MSIPPLFFLFFIFFILLISSREMMGLDLVIYELGVFRWIDLLP